jgi:hypothetical protein
LDHDRGFTHASLTSNNGKPAFKRVLDKEVPLIRSLKYFQEFSTDSENIVQHFAFSIPSAQLITGYDSPFFPNTDNCEVASSYFRNTTPQV